MDAGGIVLTDVQHFGSWPVAKLRRQPVLRCGAVEFGTALDRDRKWIGDALHLQQHAGGFNCEKQVRRLTGLPIEAKLFGMLDKCAHEITSAIPCQWFRSRYSVVADCIERDHSSASGPVQMFVQTVARQPTLIAAERANQPVKNLLGGSDQRAANRGLSSGQLCAAARAGSN
jgi:hypothetical protein